MLCRCFLCFVLLPCTGLYFHYYLFLLVFMDVLANCVVAVFAGHFSAVRATGRRDQANLWDGRTHGIRLQRRRAADNRAETCPGG